MDVEVGQQNHTAPTPTLEYVLIKTKSKQSPVGRAITGVDTVCRLVVEDGQQNQTDPTPTLEYVLIKTI